MMIEKKLDLYEIGTVPPLGYVPKKMYAWTIRKECYGEPINSYKQEIVDVPEPNDDEMIVCIMATGINYNGIWAARGFPKDLIEEHKKYGDNTHFHICGSEGSGIVYKTGKNIVKYEVGDAVVVSGPQWDYDCPFIKYGSDPMRSPSYRIWGYEANYGSFGSFALVREEQCVVKPKHLTWEEAASYIACGCTAYRMLFHWKENSVKPNDVVLVWGGAGGIGSMAVQLAKYAGALPIAVISDDEKIDLCMKLGALGCINRKNFNHWGIQPNWKDKKSYSVFIRGIARFRNEIRKILGRYRNPNIVIEHPGEDTLPTSVFLCDHSGMVVLCGGTSGYVGSFDLRPFWYFQKRIQGSHAGTQEDGVRFNKLVIDKKINPVLSTVFEWDRLGYANQLMAENRHPHGKMAVLVGSNRIGNGIGN